METEVRRKILSWYARLDLFAEVMAGHSTDLGRDWFCIIDGYYLHEVLEHPEHIDFKIEGAITGHRLIGMDLATLFSKLKYLYTGFMRENQLTAERIRTWMNPMSQLLSERKYLMNSLEGARDREIYDILYPYVPGGLRCGDLWSVAYVMMD